MTITQTSYEIPLEPDAQTFQIALAGVSYTITLWWSATTDCWNINIADANGVPILSSIPLVTGTDLLAPFGYLDFGGQLVAQTDHDPDAVPTYGNLGTTGHVYFVVTTDVPDEVVSYTNIYFGSSDSPTGSVGTGDGKKTTLPVKRGPGTA